MNFLVFYFIYKIIEMNKDFAKKIGEMMKISYSLIECSIKNCSEEKKKIMANKKTAALYIKYNTEQNIENKLKLLNKLNKNNIIYNYDKCVIKHCKNIFNDLMKILKSFINIIPETNPKRERLDKMIIELDILFNTSKLTKKQYKIYTKNITELLASIKST